MDEQTYTVAAEIRDAVLAVEDALKDIGDLLERIVTAIEKNQEPEEEQRDF